MTVSGIINIAKASIPLVIRDIEKGIEKDLLLPRKLYCSYQTVQDVYNGNPSDATLPQLSNFLFALCGGYYFEASNNIGGGGIVVNPASGVTYLTPYTVNMQLQSSQLGGTPTSTTIHAVIPSDWFNLLNVNTVIISQGLMTIGAQFTYNPTNGVFDFGLNPYYPQVGEWFSFTAFKSV